MNESILIARRLCGRLAAAALLLHAAGASALGFGPVQVHSALNQPLDASLTLGALTAPEKNTLKVGVAGPELFKRFGIERSAIADDLRVRTSIDADAGRATVRLTTPRPVHEPFLRFLLEARTSAGKTMREYTVLLDPPGQAPPAAATTTPEPSRSSANASASAQPAAPQPRRSGANPGPGVYDYGPVTRGDTLYAIASRLRRPGTTVAQMVAAIYRANPKAFKGSINLLLAGSTLKIPTRQQVNAISKRDAVAIMRGDQPQTASAPRQAQQDSADMAAPAAAPDENSNGGPDVANTAASDTAPPRKTRATLRLEPASTRPTSGAGGSGRWFGRLVEPDRADAGAASGGSAAAASAADPGNTGSAIADAAAPDAAGTGSSSTSDELGLDAVSRVDQGNGNDAPSSTAGPVATASAATGDSAGGSGSEPGSDARHTGTGVIDVVGTTATRLLTPRNLLLLLGFLLLLGWLLLRRRRNQYQPVPMNLDDDDTPIGALAGDRESETTHDAPVARAQPAPAGYAPAASVRVQDATRQMKLGMFDSARETLENGLVDAPADPTLQDKLLELDYQTGDVQAFERDVNRFESQLADNGVRWAGIAAMGRILLPSDARFAVDPVPHDASVSSRQTPAPAVSEPVGPEAGDAPEQDTVPAAAEHAAATPREPDPFLFAENQTPPAQDEPTPPPEAEPPAPDDTGSAAVRPAHDVDLDALMSANSADAPEASPKSNGKAGDRPPSAATDPDAFELDEAPDAAAEPADERSSQAGETAPEEAGRDDELEALMFTTSDVSDASLHERSEPHYDPPPADTLEFDGFDEAPSPASDAPTGDAEADDDDAEAGDMEIRLDLARMYLEMDDHQAADELLAEVMRRGDGSQQEAARALFERR